MPLLILVFAQMSAKLARLIENTLWLKCFGWPPALCERVLAQGLMWLKKKRQHLSLPNKWIWFTQTPHGDVVANRTSWMPENKADIFKIHILCPMGIKLAHILLTKYIKLVKCEFVATAKMSWTNCLWFSCVRVHLKTMHYTWAGNLYFICMSKRRKLRKTPTSWTSSSTWGCWR